MPDVLRPDPAIGVGDPSQNYRRSMRVERVDERDSSWEDTAPRFRAYFFAGDPPGYAVDTQDVTEADVLEVVRWAQTEAGPTRLYAVALVHDNPTTPSRGVVWLVGMDANQAPRDEAQRRCLLGMHDRRGRRPIGED